jgi:hypothetical protein
MRFRLRLAGTAPRALVAQAAPAREATLTSLVGQAAEAAGLAEPTGSTAPAEAAVRLALPVLEAVEVASREALELPK